jgi:ABC-type nickel/cobalt efflux system permease component RcnA
MHQTEIAHHRENRQWAFLLRPFLVAVTLGLVHALGLVGACGWIAVFVLLLLALIRGMNLSGPLITDISGVLTALIGAILRRSTRDHEAREGNAEHATYENIQFHFLSPVSEHCCAHFYFR